MAEVMAEEDASGAVVLEQLQILKDRVWVLTPRQRLILHIQLRRAMDMLFLAPGG